ncbi:MAG: hypothetical protein UY35_C0029G0004 [Candidatus Saccharibacteria bacterium GW2011_GWC2_48_9]|nr:MAG: hypothetical protein UY35_C0029G0004 [Candidatus Saccharibacteria bacterium GW2011_GWC2_48_9]HCH34970.1 hypothetical protein [Candidatus Saccharibacteria bacterium]
MAFENKLLGSVDDTYGDTHISPLLRKPQVSAYIETHQNLYSGEPGVVVSELEESLELQEKELKRRDPKVFEDVRAHLAILDTMRQNPNQQEVA